MSKHLNFIDNLGCICCESRLATHHHLLRVEKEYLTCKDGEESFLIPKVKSKGMGIKNDDRFAIPLCGLHHYELHRIGDDKKFLSKFFNEKPEEIALFLYKNTGNTLICKKYLKKIKKMFDN